MPRKINKTQTRAKRAIKQSSLKRSPRRIFSPPSFSKAQLLLVVVVVALVGVYLLWRSFAASLPPRALGVYKTADPAAITAFENWLGRKVDLIKLHFLKHSDWNLWENPGWLVGNSYFDGKSLVINFMPFPDSEPGTTWYDGNRAGSDRALANAASGVYDSHYHKAAQNLKANGSPNLFLALGHEFNGNWYPWTASGNFTVDAGPYKAGTPRYVAYRDMWKRIVPIVKQYVPHAKFTWNVAASVGSQYVNPENAYPGDQYVDDIGYNIYDQNGTYKPGQGGDWAIKRWNLFVTRAFGLNWLAQFAQNHNKPVSFPEWGLSTVAANPNGGGDNPYYIQQMYDWIRTHNVVYQAYHDVYNSENDHCMECDGELRNAAALYRELFKAASPPPPPTNKPDLIVTSIAMTPADPSRSPAGQNMVLYATIKNIGSAPTTNKKHGLIWINNANGHVVAWNDNSFDPLAPGASRTLTATGGHDGDRYWNNVGLGTHSITALIDDSKLFDESNESNNTLTKQFTVTTDRITK